MMSNDSIRFRDVKIGSDSDSITARNQSSCRRSDDTVIIVVKCVFLLILFY